MQILRRVLVAALASVLAVPTVASAGSPTTVRIEVTALGQQLPTIGQSASFTGTQFSVALRNPTPVTKVEVVGQIVHVVRPQKPVSYHFECGQGLDVKGTLKRETLVRGKWLTDYEIPLPTPCQVDPLLTFVGGGSITAIGGSNAPIRVRDTVTLTLTNVITSVKGTVSLG